MKILILGGTGFIGYHTTLECVRRGYEVTALALPPAPEKSLLPCGVKLKLADVDTMDDAQLRRLLARHDAIVHAAGADDRVVPTAPAYDFFFNTNVLSTERLFRLAREAGVARGVLLSSYFCYFNRKWPEFKLAHHHPYIRTRREQAERAFASAGGELDLTVLELPFIFGAMPGREPLWQPMVRYLRSPAPLYCPNGGTNMISIDHVVQAIVNALELGHGGKTYTVGGENHSWQALVEMFCKTMDIDKPIQPIANRLVNYAMVSTGFMHQLQGKESGLKASKLAELFTAETFVNTGPARRALKYGKGGLEQAIQDTVDACPATFWEKLYADRAQ